MGYIAFLKEVCYNYDISHKGVCYQCLEKGTLFRSDYDDWGYTDNMWSIDTELAVLLGLISKESPDSYSLNKELRPELRPTQKKTLTAIYEAFGCDEFSSDMFIATLNYSVSYTYASLHKLTLLRLLDQNILSPARNAGGSSPHTETVTESIAVTAVI